MTLADSSAFIAFLRDSVAPVADRLAALRAAGELAVTEPVVMEVLAGARSPANERSLRRALAPATVLPVGGLDSWESGASVFRACRAAGDTPRSQLDCLIAAVCIREDVPVLHADRDFDLIATHTPLRVAAAD